MLFNLRRVATSTTGTGTMTLGSAVTAYKNTTDSPAIPDQTWVTYAILDSSGGVGTASEIGYGLYSTAGPTITRNVIESTNSNSALNLSGSAQVFITPSAGDLQSNTAYQNLFRNGGMDVWQRGTATITVTTAGAYAVDGWIVLPTGASVTVDQTAGRLRTVNSMKVTGAASVTDVIVKQRIESNIAAQATSQQVTFQAWVFNNTGGSITPTLTVKHPTVADNYTSTGTDVSAVSLQPCGSAAWTQISYTFAASSSSALGMEVAVDFGNNFTTTGKSIQITECDIRVSPGFASGINYLPPAPMFRPIHEEIVFCQHYAWDPASGDSTPVLQRANNAAAGGSVTLDHLVFPTMRANPGTATLRNQSYGNASALAITVKSPSSAYLSVTATGAGNLQASFNVLLSAEL